jgi:hypothetical protein
MKIPGLSAHPRINIISGKLFFTSGGYYEHDSEVLWAAVEATKVII